jgi:hypothetical protein
VSESTQAPEPSEQGEADGAAVAPGSEAEGPATSKLEPPPAVTPAPAEPVPAEPPPADESPAGAAAAEPSPAEPVPAEPSPAYSPSPAPTPSDSSGAPPYTPAGAAELATDRPEVAVGGAFAAGFVLALILKRLAR